MSVVPGKLYVLKAREDGEFDLVEFTGSGPMPQAVKVTYNNCNPIGPDDDGGVIDLGYLCNKVKVNGTDEQVDHNGRVEIPNYPVVPTEYVKTITMNQFKKDVNPLVPDDDGNFDMEEYILPELPVGYVNTIALNNP
jgi:hypothetical protein